MFRQLAFLLILILALTACVQAQTYPMAAPSATVSLLTTTPMPALTATPVPANIQTYRNTVVGFELDYPTGWIIDTGNESSGTVILWSKKVEEPGVDGVPADVAKIDIVNPAVSVNSLDELVTWEEQIIADASNTGVHETQVQLPSGLAAVFLQGAKAGELTALLTLVNNQPLIIAGFGDVSRFMDIVKTLRAVLPTPMSITEGSCVYQATFIKDVSVPDNTVYAPGTSFTKTWRVRNDGTCDWGSRGYALSSLAFVRGDPLGAPEGVILPADIPPGTIIDISIAMKAPTTLGTYRSEWKMSGTGLLVGVGSNDAPLYVQIIVR